MNLKEFRRRADAWTEIQNAKVELERQQQEAALRRAAWVCATIMNFAGKQLQKGKKVEVDDLLKKPKTEKDIELARSQLIKRHRLKKRFGIRDARAPRSI